MDMDFTGRTEAFIRAVSQLSFSFTGVIYNPLDYARGMYYRYEDLALRDSCDVLFMGMNPGPDGMVQTGVPFGSRQMVRDYLGLEGPVGRPETEHPRRPVTGFAGTRNEASGTAFWSMIRSRYPDVRDFFSFATVQNFIPLCFITTGQRCVNVTPDKLPAKERRALEDLSLDYIGYIARRCGARRAVGIGAYACSQLVRLGCFSKVVRIMHPSPINPASRHVWAGCGREVVSQLEEEGIF